MKRKQFINSLIILILVSFQLYAQTHTITKTPQTEKSIQEESWGVYEVYSEISSEDYGLAVTTNDTVNHYFETKTGYKFNLSDVPSNAINLTASLEAYRVSGSGNSQIVLIADNTNFNNKSDVYNKVGSGTNLFITKTSSGILQNVTSYVNSKLSQGYINFGVKRHDSGIYNGKIVIKLHIDYQVSITAKNNFSGGTIKVDGVVRTSPYTFTKNVGSTVSLQAIEQSNGGYSRIWNDTEAPLNKSEWRKKKNNQYSYKSNNQSYSFTTTIDDLNSEYEAGLRKICNLNFANSFVGISYNGTINVNGTNYNSPTSNFGVVEQNAISVTATNYLVQNYIGYLFDHWSDGNTNAGRTIYPNTHNTYTAHYIGKAVNTQRNLHFNTSDPVGTPVKVMWNQHPNSNVTKYEIWRKIGFNVTAIPSKIATINRTSASTYTFIDNEIGISNIHDKNHEVSYDVKSYYSVEGTLSGDDYLTLYGDLLAKDNTQIAENTTEKTILENSIKSYPNPFNPTSTINYTIKEIGNVNITVYDALGRKVKELVNEIKTPGSYDIKFDGSNLASGIYIYTMQVNNFFKSKKMILTK